MRPKTCETAVKRSMKQSGRYGRAVETACRRIARDRISYFLIAPFMLIFLLFSVVPVLVSVGISFTSFNLLESPLWVGGDNYIRLFLADSVFLTAFKNTLLLAVVIGPVGYIISLLFAWLINELPDGLRVFFTFLFYLPSISGNIYMIWTVLFNGDIYGYLNGLLYKLGVISEPVLWLKDPRYMMGIVILVALWSSLGTSFLAFIAGFKGIDRQYYEAASVDGITNMWQELWFITLPIMRPQMMFGAVMSISSSFGVGAICTALCGFPSTDYAVHTIMNHLEDYGGQRFEMGYACAIATVLFLLMILTNRLVQTVIAKVGE